MKATRYALILHLLSGGKLLYEFVVPVIFISVLLLFHDDLITGIEKHRRTTFILFLEALSSVKFDSQSNGLLVLIFRLFSF